MIHLFSKHLLSLSLLVCLLATVTSCNKTKLRDEFQTEVTEDMPLMTQKNMETLYSDRAVVRVKIKAPEYLQMQSGNEIMPKGFYVTFFDEFGKVRTTMEGDSAYHTKSLNVWTMVGNIKVTNLKQQETLSTDLLYWDGKMREIYTNDPFRITTPTQLIDGVGMRGKEDFSHYKMAKIVGEFEVEEAEQ